MTYNIWGLPEPAGQAPWRYPEIAKRAESHDVVAFQEAWDEKAKAAIPESHPYRAFGVNPFQLIGGSGLVLASKYPIVRSQFREFGFCPVAQCPVRYGILMATIQLRPGLEIDVYQAQFNAMNQQEALRSQILELGNMILELSLGRPYVLLGSFNFDYLSPAYQQLGEQLGLEDSYKAFVDGLPYPEDEELRGYTWDTVSNPWLKTPVSFEDYPLRLDYVFFKNQPAGEAKTSRFRLSVEDSAVVFKDLISEKPLSTHYGVTTLFRINELE